MYILINLIGREFYKMGVTENIKALYSTTYMRGSYCWFEVIGCKHALLEKADEI